MLVAARRRGVEVEIVVPGPILDAQVVRRASRAMWGPLLAAGGIEATPGGSRWRSGGAGPYGSGSRNGSLE